jgi:hypothetical protein
MDWQEIFSKCLHICRKLAVTLQHLPFETDFGRIKVCNSPLSLVGTYSKISSFPACLMSKLVCSVLQDTAGQERFHALGPIYYRDADGSKLQTLELFFIS